MTTNIKAVKGAAAHKFNLKKKGLNDEKYSAVGRVLEAEPNELGIKYVVEGTPLVIGTINGKLVLKTPTTRTDSEYPHDIVTSLFENISKNTGDKYWGGKAMDGVRYSMFSNTPKAKRTGGNTGTGTGFGSNRGTTTGTVA